MKRQALRHRYGHAGRLVPLERVRRALLTPSNVGRPAYKALIFRAAKQMGYVERTPRYPNLYAAERFLERQIDDTIGW